MLQRGTNMKKQFKEFKEIGENALLVASKTLFKNACKKKGITHFHTTNIDASTPQGLIKLTAAIGDINA